MKTPRLLFALWASLVPAFAAYTYDYASLLNPYTSSKWTSNGTNTVTTNMYTSSASNGGSLIFNQALPAPANNYEVRYTVALTTSGGNYITYLRATSNAQLATSSTGTFYAVEMTNPTLSGSNYSATLNIIKCVNGSVSTVNTNTVYPHNGSAVRIVFTAANAIYVYVDNMWWASWFDSSPIASGQPGVGVSGAPSGNGMSAIDIGHPDTIAPGAINAQMVGSSVYPNHVDIQFPGAVDDTNGSGVVYYQYYRNGTWLTLSAEPELNDTTVLPSTTYNYQLQVVDFHQNLTNTYFTVTTPPAGAIDPRQAGVRSTGTYWGAGGEQIDLRSGNLNYTIPLLKAMSRGGGGASFNLSYNSQNWRQDPGGTWQLGRDVGYGYAWKLQAGSLTPVYRDYWTLDHYLFIDATGAEYILNVNTNGIWSSQESIYVYYDTTSVPTRLRFPDGSFWQLQSLSAGTEQDSGTMYPTLMEDSNGNQILITYDSAVGLGGTNSNARITIVEDVRAVTPQYPNPRNTYTFTYDQGTPIRHLTGITNLIGTAEKYTFNYAPNQPLTSPFTPSTAYGNWTFLSSIANGIPLTTAFTYDSAGSGELDKVTFPYGGDLRWAYGPCTYTGSRTLREVNMGRFLSMSMGAPELAYNIVFAPAVSTTFHPYSSLYDPDGKAHKSWYFGVDTSQPSFGILTVRQWFPATPSVNGGRFDSFTWTADSAGNPYISKDLVTEDYNNPTQVQKQTTQTRDQYGNLTQTQVYDYGNLTTPIRTYTNTYLTDPNYTSRYIFNRLLTSTVTDGTRTTALATNYYDNATNSYCTSHALTDNSPLEHDSGYNTSFLYRGNPTAIVTPAGTRCLSYDTGGNVVTHNNNGLTSNLAIISNDAAPGTITTNSLSSTMNWSNFLGLTSSAGPNGDGSSIIYDTNARPQTATSPFGAQTTFTYNDATSPPTKVATTNGHWVRTTMDGLGRTIKTETGNGTTTVSVVDTQYVPCGCSPMGKVGQVSQPHTPTGTVYWTVYHYDGLGRTTSVVAPDGSTTTYGYTGTQVTVTDPAGKSKNFFTDALGNLVQVQETDPTLNLVTTTYTYDILNHLTSVSMPRGSNTQTRTFNYLTGTTVGMDLLSATNPENGAITYAYNSDHTLHTKTDANGNQFTYSYDGYKRLTQIMVGSTVLRTFMYDTNTLDSTFSGSYTAGRLVAVQHIAFTPTGTGPSSIQFTEMYGYTRPGEVSGKRLQTNQTLTCCSPVQHPVKTLNLDAAYTYDIEGKMTSVTYPSTYSWNGSQLVTNPGPAYTYSFDSMQRAQNMTDQNSNYVVGNAMYNPANQLLSMNLYGGVNETRQYNSLNQMTHLTVSGSLDITYNFPAGTNNGKISSQVDAISGETVTYQYDSLNRLLSASGSGWSETYGYDGFGNLLSKTPTGTAPALSIAVNPATNRMTGVSGVSYDANGNQYVSGYAYDAENRLVRAPGVQYVYDSMNKRIWRGTLDGNGNLVQQVYFYGVDGQKLGNYTISATNGQGVTPAILQDSSAGTLTYFRGRLLGADRLGSFGKFYPYGEARGTPPQDTIGFATYTRDSATGLDYADQRYYANNFGRFMSPDRYVASGGPADPQSWNRYSYVAGDPLNFNDPSGQFRLYPKIEDPFGGNNGDDGSGGGGGGGCGPGWETDASLSGPCCPSGDSFAPGDPSPSPFCPAPPPPPPPPVQPYCSIDVAESGTPRDGQDVTNIGAPTNDLGLVTTLTSAQLFVQIQADLFGDTNARDWQSYQTASVTGTYQNTQGGPTVITNINRPDDGPSAGVIYYGQGTYDWLDYPGVNPFSGYKMTETFSFTSILTNKRNAFATCVVSWGFTLSDVQGRWSLVGFW